MAINSIEECNRIRPRSSASTNSNSSSNSPSLLTKISIDREGNVSATSKFNKVKKNQGLRSPYLTGDRVQLLSRITEKRLVHRKATDFISSFPLAANIYKANSDELRPVKRNNRKNKKSVLTLPNEQAHVPEVCTVSDMNYYTEYHNRDNENNKTIRKKRTPQPNSRKLRSRNKNFEFYDRDAQYCSQMNIDLDCSSTDIINPYNGDGSRLSKKSNIMRRPHVENECNPHDVWAVLRNINKFQFTPSPPISDESIVSQKKNKRINKKRNNRKDTRVIETCRTEEFAYISSFDIDSKSPSFSPTSSFDRITVIDKQNGFSKICKALEKGIVCSQNRVKDKNKLAEVSSNESDQHTKAITKIVLSEGLDVSESCNYRNRKPRLVTTMPSTSITPKLTQTEIKRRLNNTKFPITVLGKDQVSSSPMRVEIFEQFQGLDEHIWPFMVDWYSQNSVVDGSDNKKHGSHNIESLTRKNNRSERTEGNVDVGTETLIKSSPNNGFSLKPSIRSLTKVKRPQNTRYPWAKGKWASDFIENVIKKIKTGIYYNQENKDMNNRSSTDYKEASIQTNSDALQSTKYKNNDAENQFDKLIDVIDSEKYMLSVLGFNSALPALEIKTLNVKEITVKHCLTNVLVQFDVTVPMEQDSISMDKQKPFSFIPLSITDSQTRIFKCKTRIFNAMLPAELCSIVPKVMRNISDSHVQLSLSSMLLDNKEPHLSTISEITPQLNQPAYYTPIRCIEHVKREQKKSTCTLNQPKTKKRRYVQLYRKCKSTSNISAEGCNTSINKIGNIDDFFQALGSEKSLSSVFDGRAAKKILTCIIEMKNWISEISQRQAMLVLLLANKKDTPNLVRFRPVLLQGIAVNRITRASDLDMEIEVIERENFNKLSQYEGISYLTASVENQDNLLEELYWIAKTTASDYRLPFDETSERLLKSLLEKRKKLNPSYLRVMARYVGLGLLKPPSKK
ncbi:uncharacterized protein ACR2FA_000333 [Aphomia sociella]